MLVATEHRFVRTQDGVIWSDGSGHYATWRRFLPDPNGGGPFDSVTIAARVADVAVVSSSFVQVEGPYLRVAPLPSYIGPFGYFRARRQLRSAFRALIQSRHYDVYLARQPGIISGDLVQELREAGLPWISEIVGDPHEVFATGASTHPLRAIFRRSLREQQCRVAQDALGVMYVSQALATDYATKGLSIIASDVELTDDSFRFPPAERVAGPFRLALIGSMEQPYKGIDTALAVLAALRQRGRAITLTVIGDGRLKTSLMAQATALGLSDSVNWLGMLAAGHEVRAALRQIDLYIQPSRTEGMPRALLEACAWGLPALATPVGGIPDVLAPSQLVPVGDVTAWTTAIARLQDDPALLALLAQQNHRHVKLWHVDVMNTARHRLFQHAFEQSNRMTMTRGQS